MLRSYDPENDRDIVFIPVGVNYDRTLEDRSLLRALDPDAEKRSHWFVVKTTLGFMWKSLILMILSRWQRFGYAYVNFGEHVSVRQYCAENRVNFGKLERSDRFLNVKKLADQLMGAIKHVIPEAHVNQLIEELQGRGAHVYVSPRNRVESILSALNMLQLRNLVRESGGIYRPVPEEIDVLAYYANAIAHWRPASEVSMNP
jgi:glycerol-3-phosphate O-acyltransferase